MQKKVKPIILAIYSQLFFSKFDIKNEESNIKEENPTVNKTSRITIHKKGEGL